MPKSLPKINLDLNLLKPQGSSKKILARTIQWLLSAGRYIIIFVEIIVLTAFLARFKLDADLADTKEKIERVTPYLESLRSDETLIRQTQFQITTIKKFRNSSSDFASILNDVAAQTPQGVSMNNLTIESDTARLNFKITGIARTDIDLSTFMNGLKGGENFAEINLAGFGFDQGVIDFSITGSYKGGQNL